LAMRRRVTVSRVIIELYPGFSIGLSVFINFVNLIVTVWCSYRLFGPVQQLSRLHSDPTVHLPAAG
jgi:hypothetical protein